MSVYQLGEGFRFFLVMTIKLERDLIMLTGRQK